MESYVRIGGRGLKNLTYPYMGVGEVKNCQNQAYVINEWAPIEVLSYLDICALRIRSCVPKTYGQDADEKLALRLTI